jgi:aquaporin rerated protein, other eukaryote
VANKFFPSEHWIYWLGPALGALLAAGFFWFIKSCEYQTANPGQDFDDLEASAFNPETDLTRPVVSPTAVIPDRVPSRGVGSSGGLKEERSDTYQPARLGSATTNNTLGPNSDSHAPVHHHATVTP